MCNEMVNGDGMVMGWWVTVTRISDSTESAECNHNQKRRRQGGGGDGGDGGDVGVG